jgi:hypothetical protein
MFSGLQDIFHSDQSIDVASALGRLLAALFLGLCVSGVHALVKRHRSARPQAALRGTLVLLSVLLCLTTIVVGDNIARAFSIVGALSIVRFRTVVEDTRDTAFVIFAVVMGLAAGAGYLLVPLLALPIGAVAALMFGSSAATLVLRTQPVFAASEQLEQVFARNGVRAVLLGSHLRRAAAEQERSYEVTLRSEAQTRTLLLELAAIEGVVGAEWKRS